MKRVISLTLPYPPPVNHLYATFRGRRIPSKRGKDYKAAVLGICLQQGTRPLNGEVTITFTAYRPRRIGDLDNLTKCLFDSLKGSAFHDDKQIIAIHAYRQDDKLNPRVEIEIKGDL